MSQDGNPGCLKSLGFLAVVIFAALIIGVVWEGIGKVLFSIPWFGWIILIVAGIYIFNKIEK